MKSYLRLMATSLVLMAVAGTAHAFGVTPFPKFESERQRFNMNHALELCPSDPSNIGNFVSCYLGSGERRYEKELSQVKTVQADAFDTSKGDLQEVFIRWVTPNGRFSLPAGIAISASANFGSWRGIFGFISTSILHTTTVSNGSDYPRQLPIFYGERLEEFCTPDVNRGGYVTTYDSFCTTNLTEALLSDGVRIATVDDSADAENLFGKPGGGTIDLTFDLATNFIFSVVSDRSDLPDDIYFSRLREGSVRLVGDLEVVYLYTPTGTPRGGTGGGGGQVVSNPAPVPVPASLGLLLGAVGLLGAASWRAMRVGSPVA